MLWRTTAPYLNPEEKLVLLSVINTGKVRLTSQLGSAFTWKLTPQGWEYWNRISDEITYKDRKPKYGLMLKQPKMSELFNATI